MPQSRDDADTTACQSSQVSLMTSALTLLDTVAYLLKLFKYDIIFNHLQTFKRGLNFSLLLKVKPTRTELMYQSNSELCTSELSHC